MRTDIACFLLNTLVLACGAVNAQSLVRDINTQPPSQTMESDPQFVISTNGVAYFTATDSYRGRELWRTDGTAAGTLPVADLFPGTQGSMFDFAEIVADSAGTVYFVASSPTSGLRLWRSDGTLAGSVVLSPSLQIVAPDRGALHVVGTDVYFWASDGVHGIELWKSDGTLAGTAMVTDIHSGSGHAFDRQRPMYMAHVGNTLYFSADDGVHGVELWRTDGTAAGTWLVHDVNVGLTGSDPHGLVEVGGQLLFAAQWGRFGPVNWWRVNSGDTSASVVTNAMEPNVRFGVGVVVQGGVAYFNGGDFTAGGELWRTDGTDAGTFRVADIHPSGSSSPYDFVEFGGDIWFTANDGATGEELWKSDGTAAGTIRVADLEPGSRGSRPLGKVEWNGELYFVGSTLAEGRELWKTDGTGPGTNLVTDLKPGGGSSSIESGPLATTHGIVFAGDDGVTGFEPWVTDGSAAGTFVLNDIETSRSSSDPIFFESDAGLTYFVANDGLTGQEPWVTDGTAAGTMPLRDVAPGPRWSSVVDMKPWRDAMYFGSESGIWRTNGTLASTNLVVSTPRVGALLPFQNELFFSGNNSALWKTDGTAQGTTQVRSFAVSFYPVGPQGLVEVGGAMFFAASEGGFAPAAAGVWKSDGTAAGTQLVVPIAFNGFGAIPIEIVPTDHGVFVGSAGDVWFTDGTTTTQLVNSLPPPLGPGDAPELTRVGDEVFFGLTQPGTGRELWKSDGTVAGTQLVADIRPGSGSSSPRHLAAAGGLLWFAADDGQHGVELWKSDGTAAGTVLVADAWPGASGSEPTEIAAAGSGDRVVYSASDVVAGRELWISDGTAVGTRRIADLRAGALPSVPVDFFRAGTTLFFVADDGATGAELWSMPLAATGGHLVENYGSSCPGNGGIAPSIYGQGIPAPGSTDLSVSLQNGLESAAAALLVSPFGAELPLGIGGCELLVGAPLASVPMTTNAAGEASFVAGPALLGAEFFFQYAVLDPAGAFLGVASFSGGLRVMFGN